MEDGAMGKISPVGREELLTTLVQWYLKAHYEDKYEEIKVREAGRWAGRLWPHSKWEVMMAQTRAVAMGIGNKKWI